MQTTEDEMYELFVEALQEIEDDLPSDLAPEMSLADLGIDSLALIELGMIIEEKLDVTADEEALEGVETVADAVRVFSLLASGS